MFVSAIIAAGGKGLRLGGSRPKQLLSIAGRPVLDRSVSAFLSHPAISEVVVALPEELLASPPEYLQRRPRLRLVSGGGRRQDSVASAFAAIDPRAELVVVHDAARPFVSAALIDRTIAAAAESGAALAAVASRDTVKQSDGAGRVATTLPREAIFLAQTPQAFRREVLRSAIGAAGGGDATDEAALAERAGHAVALVEGEAANMKITTPDDLPIAEAIARARDGALAPLTRIGTGYDLHRLVPGRPLVLAGVTIPFDRGLAGHSDADAICHAVTDAVLGAIAAGDIGRHFPDTDEAWRGASSVGLLQAAMSIVRDRGWRIVNVDVVVIAERPKLAPHVDAMRASLADALGTAVDNVSIKGKTNEGIGELGRGEAIAVHAVALLERRS